MDGGPQASGQTDRQRPRIHTHIWGMEAMEGEREDGPGTDERLSTLLRSASSPFGEMAPGERMERRSVGDSCQILARLKEGEKGKMSKTEWPVDDVTENMEVFHEGETNIRYIFQAQQRRRHEQRSPEGRRQVLALLRAHLQRLRVAAVPPAVAQLPRHLPAQRHLRLPRPRPPGRRPRRPPRPRRPLAAVVGAARRAGAAGQRLGRRRGRQPRPLVRL